MLQAHSSTTQSGQQLTLVRFCVEGMLKKPDAVQVICYERRISWRGTWPSGLETCPSPSDASTWHPTGWSSGNSVLEEVLPLLDESFAFALHEDEAMTSLQRWLGLCQKLIGLTIRCLGVINQSLLVLQRPVVTLNSVFGGRSALLTQVEARLRMQGQMARDMAQWSTCFKTERREQSERLLLFFGVLVVLFDTILGWLFYVLITSSDLLSSFPAVHRWAYGKQLAHLVHWLMGAPADFKLNRELTSFAGSFFLSMFSLWDHLLFSLQANAALDMFACLCAVLGGSFLLTFWPSCHSRSLWPTLVLAYVGRWQCDLSALLVCSFKAGNTMCLVHGLTTTTFP